MTIAISVLDMEFYKLWLSNFGNNQVQPVVPVTQTWPAVSYASVQPTSYNFLVKTNNGLVMCRTTDKNFVFCM